MQLKYSNYAAFSHVHGVAVNNSGQLIDSIDSYFLEPLSIEQKKTIKKYLDTMNKRGLIINER